MFGSPPLKAVGALAALAVIVGLVAPALALQPNGEFRPLTDWRAFRGTGIPSTWTFTDGVIDHVQGGGDLVSAESFENFELDFDWKVSAGTDSGVMYRVSEDYEASWWSGPEYEILDNKGHPNGKDPATSAASCYGLYGPPNDVTRPVGQWNSARIIVEGTHVEHWLNGFKVVQYELGTAAWKRKVASTKFAAWPEYGTIPSGHIVLQDETGAVSYRNLMIRVLPPG